MRETRKSALEHHINMCSLSCVRWMALMFLYLDVRIDCVVFNSNLRNSILTSHNMRLICSVVLEMEKNVSLIFHQGEFQNFIMGSPTSGDGDRR